ncbi:MAG: aspartyl protease family protein [bacterium]|nr:aspartyl protease family protein [bacterium]
MKLKIIISLLTVSLLGCNYSKNVSLLLSGSVDRKDFVQEIPFEYRKGLIVVKAAINNDTTLREFIFDTGAFNSKIEKHLAEQHGLETVATKENSTAQGNTKFIDVVQIDSLIIGETVFRKIGAGKVEYSENSASPCIAEHGIIGANLIKLVNWKIDYQNKKIYFSDLPFETGEGSIVIGFDRPVFSATPKIDISLENKTVSGVLFDTGFNGGLILPRNVSSSFASNSNVYIDQSTTGIYGSNIDTLIEKKLSLDLDKVSAKIQVEFSSLGKGLIGNEVLEHFEVIIDNQDNEILLKQITDIDIGKSHEMIPGILNDSLWVVNRIQLNSNTDLKLGDTLSTINGYHPKELFSSHCDYFMRIGEIIANDTSNLTFTRAK